MRTMAMARTTLTSALVPFVLLGATALAGVSSGSESTSDPFVWPGHGVPEDRLVWGHRDGLRIGIAPNPGPQGLIRIYAPYLDQTYPRVVNFLSIEPTRAGDRGRGQSELERSRERPGEPGLTFRVSDFAVVDDVRSARLFVHTEPFRNGTRPIVEVVFHRERPREIELVLHADEASAPMSQCVISATMGNYGLLRQLQLTEGRNAFAPRLWSDAEPAGMGFYNWRSWPSDQFPVNDDGRVIARATTDVERVDDLEYAPNTAPHWKYRGKLASHYWKAEASDRPIVAVNGRRTYWRSRSPIPGGIAFENFELRMPYRDGLRMWFGVEP